MEAYSKFLGDVFNASSLSVEVKSKGKSLSKDESNAFDDSEEEGDGIRLASEPGLREQGNVMIDINSTSSQYQDTLHYVAESLRKNGYKVRLRYEGIDMSLESVSDGIMPGNMSLNGNNAVNNVMNGVYVPDFKDTDLFKQVTVIQPQDHAPENKDGVLFMVDDGNGEMSNYLKDEGYQVASDAETLELLLSA
jgi:hypothetical protein